jgi:hypothetical protein
VDLGEHRLFVWHDPGRLVLGQAVVSGRVPAELAMAPQSDRVGSEAHGEVLDHDRGEGRQVGEQRDLVDQPLQLRGGREHPDEPFPEVLLGCADPTLLAREPA